jgi:hypothetical protein
MLSEEEILNRPMLTTEEAAFLLGVTEARLREWRSQGRGPRFTKYGEGRGGLVRYKTREILRWRSEHEREGTFEYTSAGAP